MSIFEEVLGIPGHPEPPSPLSESHIVYASAATTKQKTTTGLVELYCCQKTSSRTTK